MRVVNADDLEYQAPGTRHREGNIRFKYLLRGAAGSPQNYEFLLAHTGGGFPSPAHRHNFDQIRFGLHGAFGDGKGTEVRAGHCGYYPEGAPYSIDSQESEVILLQFGGASGWGFTHFPQLFQAYSELSRLGEFRGGRFYRARPEGEPEGKMQDGYEALWQHINGKPVVYPLPRYSKPVIMDPESFAWRPIQPGVSRKVLGIFTERAIEVGLIKIQAQTEWQFPAMRAPCLTFVLEGSGRAGEVDWSTHAAGEIAAGEIVRYRTAADTLLFYSVLPTFDVGELAAASREERVAS
jgi:hypothetical protein